MNVNTYQWLTVALAAIATACAIFNVLKDIKNSEKSKKDNNGNNQVLITTPSEEPQICLEKQRKLSINSIVMISIVLALVGVVCWQFYSQKHPIVFAGGGSVMNYLADRVGVDVRELDNSISVALASGTSWSLLNEHQHANKKSDKNNNSNEKQHANKKSNRNNNSHETFIPVCLSAGKISEDFKSEYFSKMEDAIIVEVLLGYDTLVTYVSYDIKKDWGKTESDFSIKSNELNDEIKKIVLDSSINKKRDIRIFTTNKTSGTLELYKKYLPNIDLEKMIDQDEAQIFYDNVDPNMIKYYYTEEKTRKTRSFIILGSQHYTAEVDCKPLSVVDTNGHYIRKPLYLYFLTDEKKDLNSNYYKIDKKIVKFLKKIEKEMDNKKIKIPDTALKEIKEIKKNKKIYYSDNNDTLPKIKTIILDSSYYKKEE